jgi:hypothetical protein
VAVNISQVYYLLSPHKSRTIFERECMDFFFWSGADMLPQGWNEDRVGPARKTESVLRGASQMEEE